LFLEAAGIKASKSIMAPAPYSLAGCAAASAAAALPDEMPRAVVQGDMDRDDVGNLEELLDIFVK